MALLQESSLVTHLATEGAGVLGMLADLNLFHHLPKGGTITGTIFPNNSHLLGAFGLQTEDAKKQEKMACFLWSV